MALKLDVEIFMQITPIKPNAKSDKNKMGSIELRQHQVLFICPKAKRMRKIPKK